MQGFFEADVAACLVKSATPLENGPHAFQMLFMGLL